MPSKVWVNVCVRVCVDRRSKDQKEQEGQGHSGIRHTHTHIQHYSNTSRPEVRRCGMCACVLLSGRAICLFSVFNLRPQLRLFYQRVCVCLFLVAECQKIGGSFCATIRMLGVFAFGAVCNGLWSRLLTPSPHSPSCRGNTSGCVGCVTHTPPLGAFLALGVGPLGTEKL